MTRDVEILEKHLQLAVSTGSYCEIKMRAGGMRGKLLEVRVVKIVLKRTEILYKNCCLRTRERERERRRRSIDCACCSTNGQLRTISDESGVAFSYN